MFNFFKKKYRLKTGNICSASEYWRDNIGLHSLSLDIGTIDNPNHELINDAEYFFYKLKLLRSICVSMSCASISNVDWSLINTREYRNSINYSITIDGKILLFCDRSFVGGTIEDIWKNDAEIAISSAKRLINFCQE